MLCGTYGFMYKVGVLMYWWIGVRFITDWVNGEYFGVQKRGVGTWIWIEDPSRTFSPSSLNSIFFI